MKKFITMILTFMIMFNTIPGAIFADTLDDVEAIEDSYTIPS